MKTVREPWNDLLYRTKDAFISTLEYLAFFFFGLILGIMAWVSFASFAHIRKGIESASAAEFVLTVPALASNASPDSAEEDRVLPKQEIRGEIGDGPFLRRTEFPEEISGGARYEAGSEVTVSRDAGLIEKDEPVLDVDDISEDPQGTP